MTGQIARTLLTLVLCGSAQAEHLSIERLFADPALDGPSPRSVKISPDGARVSFLQGKSDDQNQLDLWEYNIDAAVSRLLVDSKVLLPGEEVLSDEEKARRERKRISSSRGIVEYFFAPDGTALLFPLGGDLYYYDLKQTPDEAVRRLTETKAFETDPKFSPKGNFVSFIRDQDLFAIELASGKERRLTRDGDGLIKNGMAEFIAQEEMLRRTGYWWSPDESAIAFTRIDESPVAVYERFEIYAENFKVYPQRYPAAGTNNALIQLGVVGTKGGRTRWMDLGEETDIYVARVDWFPDAKHLAVQRQTRDQKRLDLLKLSVRDGSSKLLLSETSDTWIDLHDELTFLKDSEGFVWASSRSGFKHLYLYDLEGNLLRQLTSGEWVVAGNWLYKALLGVDESEDLIYFMATKDSPLERHLYRAPLIEAAGRGIERITQEEGWHIVDMSKDGSLFVDTFSSPDAPPSVSLHRTDGSRIAYLEQNALDDSHPYQRYLDHHARMEFGTLKAADGQTLYYRLIKPTGFQPDAKYPAIVDVYGGPHGQRVRKKWNIGWQQYMARNGYVVFALDNRGTSFRGVEFDAPIHLRLGSVEVEDQVAGVEFLKTFPFIDAQRIGIYGWSYGGYMTLMTMMKMPTVFAAGVSGAPVTDWLLYDTHYTERYLGHPGVDPRPYEASSVFPYVADLEKPLLVVHGMADDNVLFSNSTKLFKALQDEGLPFETMTYPGSKHGLIRQEKAGTHFFKTMKLFFDRHLK